MFFGFRVISDRNGNFLGVNKRLGKGGLAFQTKSISTALYDVASDANNIAWRKCHHLR